MSTVCRIGRRRGRKPDMVRVRSVLVGIEEMGIRESKGTIEEIEEVIASSPSNSSGNLSGDDTVDDMTNPQRSRPQQPRQGRQIYRDLTEEEVALEAAAITSPRSISFPAMN